MRIIISRPGSSPESATSIKEVIEILLLELVGFNFGEQTDISSLSSIDTGERL